MSAYYRMHIAAFVQRNNERLFRDIHRAYAQEHSKGIAQYMADTLQYWDSGKVDVKESSLERFSTVVFPTTSREDREWLIQSMYEEYKSKNPQTHYLKFRIDYNIEDQTRELERIVEDFNSDGYDLQLSWHFNGGIQWICRDDEKEALAILYRYTHPIGQDNYASVKPAVKEFLHKLKAGKLPIPFEQRIDFIAGYILLDYNFRLRTRIGDKFKNLGRKISALWK